MNFSCLSEEEVRRKYHESADKAHIIEVIAGLTCASKREVKKFLGLKGKPRNARKEHVHVDTIKATKMHAEGCTDKEIAECLGVTSSAVGIWRRKLGLPINSKSTEEERMALYRMGMNDAEIGEALGLSKTTIFSWRKSRNLPPNATQGGDNRKKKEKKQWLY